jgi:hypothetical protein
MCAGANSICLCWTNHDDTEKWRNLNVDKRQTFFSLFRCTLFQDSYRCSPFRRNGNSDTHTHTGRKHTHTHHWLRPWIISLKFYKHWDSKSSATHSRNKQEQTESSLDINSSQNSPSSHPATSSSRVHVEKTMREQVNAGQTCLNKSIRLCET